MEKPRYDVIIGNVPGVMEAVGGVKDNWNDMVERVQAVITRQAAKNEKLGETAKSNV